MRPLLSIAFIVFILNDPALPQWIPQPSPTTAYLSDVEFASEQLGWIAGGEVLLKTEDGGASWMKQDFPGYYLDELHFLDSSLGWVVGCRKVGTTQSRGLILKTTNGGDSWAIIDSSRTGCFDSVYFIDELHGWIAGSQGPWPDTLGLILRTIDGGDSWVRVDSGKVSYLRDIFFLDSVTGWAVGEWGHIYKSTDGGASWQLVAQAVFWDGTFESPLRQIYFATPDSGWVVGGITGTGVTGRTTDGGNSWEFDVEFVMATLHGLWFMDTERGWTVGGSGRIFSTLDGGNSWTLQQEVVINERKPVLTSVCMISDKEGWIVGEKGTMLKTTNGGLTSVEKPTEGIPSQFKLYQNYPNPFNPRTTIRFQVPKLSLVTIKVFNTVGQEVATVFNDVKPAGTHQVVFKASDLSSGVYFYRLQAGGFTETKKLVVLK